MILSNSGTKEKLKVNVDQNSSVNKALVLYNDDVHSFDFVIKALIRICNHTAEQAEQSAYIVHNNGKCVVKHGKKTKIEPMCQALIERGLIAQME